MSLKTQEESSTSLDAVYLLRCKKPELVELCSTYGLNTKGTKESLMQSLLKGKDVTLKKESKKDKSNDEHVNNGDRVKLDPEYLVNCSKSELIVLCRKYSLKTTGTKESLMQSLIRGENVSLKREKAKNSLQELMDNSKSKTKNKTKTKTNTKTKCSKPQKRKTKKKTEPKKVISNLMSGKPVISIRKNMYGNNIHEDTMLVFDKVSNQVIGKQDTKGNVQPLTRDDIEICHRENFPYELPENLNTKTDDVYVEELDNEEELDENDMLDIGVEDENEDEEDEDDEDEEEEEE